MTILRRSLVVALSMLLVLPAYWAYSETHKSPLVTDHEFDGGSRVSLQTLSPVQVENLYTLGKVWGFVKYHHPAVTGGSRHWDYDLFRVMPEVLAAPDRAATNKALHGWIGALGPVKKCSPCATLPGADLYAGPRIDWIKDARTLGAELSADLQDIYRNRSAANEQFYVAMVPNIGNPKFTNEQTTKDLAFPDAGYQLLGLFRAWNVVEYWAPYRDQVDGDWDEVLRRTIPKVALAKTRPAFELEMIAFIALQRDTHANLWSSLKSRPPVGECRLPVEFRFVEGKALVTGYLDEALGKASGIQPGDILEAIDGKAVDSLVREWTPYYAASNEPTRLRDIGRNLGKGECREASLKLRRPSGVAELQAARVPQAQVQRRSAPTHDRPGPTFQMLADDIAYIKLSSIQKEEIPSYLEKAKDTKGLIIDIRNYPSDFVPFALGQHLVDKPTEFVRFTQGDPANPGAFTWTPNLVISPKAPRYKGKVVILVDEVSQSQSEYTAMALRTAPGAKVIGSTTAGADGNISSVPIPGQMNSLISGIGVFYPDKRPTQRVGIVADVDVRPTIEGIRNGKDEVLEAAILEIRGGK